MNDTNEMMLEFDSKSENESFARIVVAGFIMQLDPNMEELADIKTAVSEAVTNCIIHGYNGGKGKIKLKCCLTQDTVFLEVIDMGCGIENVEKAMEPMFTTKTDLERSGMGFAFMEAFMDDIKVISNVGEGTTVKMSRTIKSSNSDS